MFKLVVLSGLLAVALAKPSTLVSPVVGKLVSEKTIESHGNSIVHAAAPIITPAIPLVNAVEHVVPVAPVISAKAAAIVSEKTIESHGHSIVHHSVPAATISYVAPATPVVAAAAAAPVVVAQAKQVLQKSEKTQESSEKSESSQQSKELIKKIETIVQQSNEVQSQEKAEPSLKSSSESLQRNETAQSKAITEKTESHGQFIIHQAAPAVLTYQAAPLLATPYVFPAEVPSFAFIPRRHVTDFSQKAESAEKLKSAESEQQSAEKLKTAENGAIQEVATGLHLAAPSVYYYPYPAAVVAEKSISSYGHSIIHAA